MQHQSLFFRQEREHRCRAARSRDLAATTDNPAERRAFLDDAARHARATPTSLNELLLIRR